MRQLALLLLFALPGASASLPERIRELLDAAPALRGAFWGIQAVELSSGKVLYQQNAEHLFIPASNTKLFTTAMALQRLGPDFTFETRVVADAAADMARRIRGPLRLIGGGDPNLSGRAIPYRMGPPPGDPLAAIEDLAAQIAAAGVKRVDGDVVGDDTWYVWQPYPAGWGIDDPESDDGAPVSALTLNDNTIRINLRPGIRDGDPAVLSLQPALEFYRLENRVHTVETGGPRVVHFDRLPGSRQARIWGTIPRRDRGIELAVAVEDPAEYAAQALIAALENRGITVEGRPVALHLYPDQVRDLTQGAPVAPPSGVQLARRVSPALVEDLRITDKVSQNLHAELLLRAVGRSRRNVGSLEAGLEEMKTFLTEVGIEPESYFLRDGSGLARLNLVTPDAVMKLLRFMYATPLRDTWISLLPVGGEDGTLSNRFGGSPAAGRVHAKTGSLSHVAALSGYLQRNDGAWVAFSILVNNFNAPAAEIRGVMDRICTLISE